MLFLHLRSKEEIRITSVGEAIHKQLFNVTHLAYQTMYFEKSTEVNKRNGHFTVKYEGKLDSLQMSQSFIVNVGLNYIYAILQ